MSTAKIILSAFAISALMHCAPGPQFPIIEARKISPGMTKQEVIGVLKEEPLRIFAISDGNDSLTVLRYLVDMTADGEKMTINDVLYVLLRDDSASYWGLIRKFKLSDDARIRNTADSVVKYDQVFFRENHNDSTITPKFVPPARGF